MVSNDRIGNKHIRAIRPSRRLERSRDIENAQGNLAKHEGDQYSNGCKQNSFHAKGLTSGLSYRHGVTTRTWCEYGGCPAWSVKASMRLRVGPRRVVMTGPDQGLHRVGAKPNLASQ